MVKVSIVSKGMPLSAPPSCSLSDNSLCPTSLFYSIFLIPDNVTCQGESAHVLRGSGTWGGGAMGACALPPTEM